MKPWSDEQLQDGLVPLKEANLGETFPVECSRERMKTLIQNAAAQLSIPLEKIDSMSMSGNRLWVRRNSLRFVPGGTGEQRQGRYFIPEGWYILHCGASNEHYCLQPVARKASVLLEFGPSCGSITPFHLRSLPLFEAVLGKATKGRKRPVRPALSGSARPRLTGGLWGLVFDCLVRGGSPGAFCFEFDGGLLELASADRAFMQAVCAHPVWITKMLRLGPGHVAAAVSHPAVSCAGIAKYVCANAKRLPDVIRRDPGFKTILNPATRHAIAKKQDVVAAPLSPEAEPKARAVQLLFSFLLSEPKYRGDTEMDLIAAELEALCKAIAKSDPIFVLKLAHYARHTLTVRNTANFLLATAATIAPCGPFVRTALPKSTNLPTDLLELWDFWRKLRGRIQLPACVKKGMADKFSEFSEYQLGKYLNARVPKGDAASMPKDTARRNDPLVRPLTIKALIRAVHAGKGQEETVCGVLGKHYPRTEAEFEAMKLGSGGNSFDPSRVGENFRVPVPKTWETQLSERGNTPEVWEDLVRSKKLPFMAMLRNLRNLLMAGVSQEVHEMVLSRLKSVKQVAGSKQLPVRFLSAFEAIDFSDDYLERLRQEAALGEDYVEEQKAYGAGQDAKVIKRRRRICRRPPTRELLEKYRDGLETAVSLAASTNVPELFCPTGGKAVVLVDVSGSMESPLTQGPKRLHESALTPHHASTGLPIVEGQDMDLEDYFSQSGQRHTKKISVSMTWIGNDLDLSCMILDQHGGQVSAVSFSNLAFSACSHSGDIVHAPDGAEEIITVDLGLLPENAFMLTFTVNSFSGETFDEMAEAAISIRDDGLVGNSVEGTQEICAFRLTGSSRAVLACALIRKDRGWTLRCLNTPQGSGRTVQSLVAKIRKEYEAVAASAATQVKRLVDASLMLALCLHHRMGPERCEVVLFSSPGKDGGPGHHAVRSLGPKVLQNVRRCHAAARQLGLGTELPITYLQELRAAGTKLDHIVLLTDGLVSPSSSPEDALSRWLTSYRASVQPVRFACVDVLGLGPPCLNGHSSPDDVLISGYAEATLRYLASDPGAQLAEIEAIEILPPKAATKPAAGAEAAAADAGRQAFSPPPRTAAPDVGMGSLRDLALGHRAATVLQKIAAVGERNRPATRAALASFAKQACAHRTLARAFVLDPREIVSALHRRGVLARLPLAITKERARVAQSLGAVLSEQEAAELEALRERSGASNAGHLQRAAGGWQSRTRSFSPASHSWSWTTRPLDLTDEDVDRFRQLEGQERQKHAEREQQMIERYKMCEKLNEEPFVEEVSLLEQVAAYCRHLKPAVKKARRAEDGEEGAQPRGQERAQKPLTHSIETMWLFECLGLEPPANLDAVPEALRTLEARLQSFRKRRRVWRCQRAVLQKRILETGVGPTDEELEWREDAPPSSAPEKDGEAAQSVDEIRSGRADSVAEWLMTLLSAPSLRCSDEHRQSLADHPEAEARIAHDLEKLPLESMRVPAVAMIISAGSWVEVHVPFGDIVEALLAGGLLKEDGARLAYALPVFYELPRVDPAGVFRKTDHEPKKAARPEEEPVQVYEEKQRTTRMTDFSFRHCLNLSKYGDVVDSDGDVRENPREKKAHARKAERDKEAKGAHGQKNARNKTEQEKHLEHWQKERAEDKREQHESKKTREKVVRKQRDAKRDSNRLNRSTSLLWE